jgi:ADP-ribose diphosphatase
VRDGTLLDRRPIHRGRVLDYSIERVLLPNGNEVELDMVRHPGAAAVVPFVTPDEILLIRQFRWATAGWIYEVPAGKLDGEPDPAVCAARELEEEVGQRAGRLEPLGMIWTTPGFSDERIHLFMASDLTAVPTAHERDEVIEVVRRPLAEVLAMARRGEIQDAKSLCALLHVLLRLGRVPGAPA